MKLGGERVSGVARKEKIRGGPPIPKKFKFLVLPYVFCPNILLTSSTDIIQSNIELF